MRYLVNLRKGVSDGVVKRRSIFGNWRIVDSSFIAFSNKIGLV